MVERENPQQNPLNDPEPPYDPSEYYDPDPDDDDLCEHGKIMDECRWCEADYNCGLMHDGQCSMAGSEYCDFECPNRDSAMLDAIEAETGHD